jgi:hypothetical protein
MALTVIRRLTSLLALVALLSGSPARADTMTLSFPGPDTYWSSRPAASGEAGSGYGATNPIWFTGAYLTETFTGVGLYSVSSVQLSYSVGSGLLNGSETWDTYLNGQLIGSDTIVGNYGGGLYCYCGGQYTTPAISSDTFTYTDSFAPIVGNGTYTLEFYLAQGVAPGYGSIFFYDSGSAVLTGDAATPLPAALPLFATGLGALGLLGWRRKRGRAIPIT